MKKKGSGANPYAVCQKATGQSYATGEPLQKFMRRRNRKQYGKD